MARKAKQTETGNGDWAWNAPKRRAAVLLAEDELTDAEIAAEVGVSRTVLWRWKCRPEFDAEVKARAEELGAVAARYAVGRRARRVAAIDGRWRRLRQVMDERGADPSMAGVPGGTTGLLVRRIRSVGTGDQQQIVTEYELDAALLREAREHEKAAAVELGQADAPPPDADAPLFPREEG